MCTGLDPQILIIDKSVLKLRFKKKNRISKMDISVRFPLLDTILRLKIGGGGIHGVTDIVVGN